MKRPTTFLSMLALMSIMNAFAMAPITDDDIDNINKILNSPFAIDTLRKMLKEDADLAKRYKENEKETMAFMSNEVIKRRCENIDKKFEKIEKSVSGAKKNLEKSNSALINAKLTDFDLTIAEEENAKELESRKQNLKKVEDLYSETKKDLEERKLGSAQIKVKEMKDKWMKSNQDMLKNKKGILQSEKSYVQEQCTKFLLPFQKELHKRSVGTSFEKEVYKLWSGTSKNCKQGHWVSVSLGISQTGDKLAMMDGHYADSKINSVSNELTEVAKVKEQVVKKVEESDLNLKKAKLDAVSLEQDKFKDDKCLPLLKDAGLLSDSIRDSGYTEGLNIAEALDSAINKLKATCTGDSIKRAVFIADYKQLSEALKSADVYELKLKKTADAEESECKRSREVYEVLRKNELKAYKELVEKELEAKKIEEEKKKQEEGEKAKKDGKSPESDSTKSEDESKDENKGESSPK